MTEVCSLAALTGDPHRAVAWATWWWQKGLVTRHAGNRSSACLTWGSLSERENPRVRAFAFLKSCCTTHYTTDGRKGHDQFQHIIESSKARWKAQVEWKGIPTLVCLQPVSMLLANLWPYIVSQLMLLTEQVRGAFARRKDASVSLLQL